MVQEGKVRLEDPVQKYLTGVTIPAFQGKPITLGSLSEQNSGLPRMPSNFKPADPANPYADYTVAQMYEFLSGYTLPRAPGAQFEYSNLGVGLLGHVLATVDGKPYEQMLKDRIFTPLGMTQTAITLTRAMRQRMAMGHNAQGDVVSNWDITALAGAGAIRSTATDMLKFADANLHPERGPLQKAMAMAQAPRFDAGNNMRIGLNWITMAAGPDTIVWHNGGTGGYRTWLGLAPSHRRAVLVLTNTGGVGADDIGMHLLAPAIPLAPKPAPVKQRVAITLPADSLSPYVGTYQAGPGLTLEVTFADGILSVQPSGQQKLRLWPETATDFFVKEADVQFTFVRDASGKVTTIVIHQNGGNLPAAKIR
jgi:CubicO group peptidase (beta-lactamase class C family)